MAEHATFWRMKVRPGKLQELRAVMDAEEGPRLASKGWVRTVVGSRKDDAEELWGAVLWDTSANYFANADSAEQNEWYQKMRSLLVSDPDWFDCDVIDDAHA